MKKYKGGIVLKKLIVCTVLIIMVVLSCNYSHVNADTSEVKTAKFYMNQEKYDVEEGEEITIKLNLSASNMIGCVSVLEYDKELKLVNINITTNISKSPIFSPQINKDGTISEIEVNGKKRFVFTVLSSDMNGVSVEEDTFAEITVKVPDNVPKGKTFVVGWNKDPELTYMEDFNGAKTLEPFKDTVITVVKSDYVEGSTIEEGVDDTLNGNEGNQGNQGNNSNVVTDSGSNSGAGTTGSGTGTGTVPNNKPTENKDGTTANKNHVQAGSISSYIFIVIICGLIALTVYFKYKKNN